MKVKVTQSRPALCDAMGYSTPASSVQGGSSQPRDQTLSFTALATRESPHHLTYYIFIFKDYFLSLLYGAGILLTQQCTPSAQGKKKLKRYFISLVYLCIFFQWLC